MIWFESLLNEMTIIFTIEASYFHYLNLNSLEIFYPSTTQIFLKLFIHKRSVGNPITAMKLPKAATPWPPHRF